MVIRNLHPKLGWNLGHFWYFHLDSYSNNSYIVTFEPKKKETNSGYKVKERSQSASHTLHTLLPDEDDTPGCKHAFTKAIFVPGQGYIGPPSTMTEKKPIGQTGSTVKSKSMSPLTDIEF